MQEQHFENLVEDLQQRAPKLKEEIRQAFEAVRKNGTLLTLTEEEVKLLEDYRVWKKHPNSATGVFHWKRVGEHSGEQGGT